MARDLTDDLDSLMRARRDQENNTPLPAPKVRGAFPSTSASGVESAPKSSGGGSVGDLTEMSLADRTYWDAVITTSTDGLITREDRPIKMVKMTDANGKVIRFSFAR